MPAYLVRMIGSRDLVGFYYAEEPDDLLMIIDEITDPDACEYTELPDGGITWGSPAIEVPIEDDVDADGEEQTPDVPFAGASLSESCGM